MAKSKAKKKINLEGVGISQPESSPEKQAARQAHMQTPIPPPQFIAEALREAKKKPEPKSEDDEIVAEGANSDFWKILKRWIEWKQKGIKENTGQMLAGGTLTLEQIGMKVLWRDLIIEFGQDMIDFIENRATLVESIKREKQEENAEQARKQSESAGVS